MVTETGRRRGRGDAPAAAFRPSGWVLGGGVAPRSAVPWLRPAGAGFIPAGGGTYRRLGELLRTAPHLVICTGPELPSLDATYVCGELESQEIDHTHIRLTYSLPSYYRDNISISYGHTLDDI